jgi:hypothetical protein
MGMLTILIILAVAYVVLKVINTKAKFDEADARREAEEEQERLAQEEFEEEAMMRAEAVDVDAEVSAGGAKNDEWENDWSIEE